MYHDLFVTSLPKAFNNKDNLAYFKGNSSFTKEDIIMGNMRLVAMIVNKYKVSEEDKKDLFQTGLIGLMKAIDSYNYEKGVLFSSYAVVCIQNEIGMQMRKINKNNLVVSMDEAIDSNEEFTLSDTLIDEKDNIEENYDKKEAINLLKELVVSLNIRDTFIVSLYFGLFENDAIIQEEIAMRLNISRAYVTRLVNRILNTLKELIVDPPKDHKRRGRKGSSIFKLLKGYDKKLILEVISELSEEDRILLYLRGGYDLSNPCPSPFWNKNTAYKFNTKLMPKIKEKLEEKIWSQNHQVKEESLSPREIYRRRRINEIHNFLISIDMANAQIALHEYLVDFGLSQYEKFIVSLIILSVMDQDFTFLIPIRSLVLLEKGYIFNGLKYKDYFYEALMNNIREASLYLDIISCLQKNGMINFDIEPLEEAYERVLTKNTTVR